MTGKRARRARSDSIGQETGSIGVLKCRKQICSALLEAETELGENAVLRENDGTFGVVNARSGATVLAAGTAASVIKTRVTPIRPQIGKIVT
jgi:hypothetical protein